MRVLYVSDVYFPRVNGVSTSIRTFRADLATDGVETVLVAPAWPTPPDGAVSVPASAIDEPGLVRVPSSAVPGDPEDRRMHWRPLMRALEAEAVRGVDLVHIQTPFIAHYAGVRIARRLRVPVVATYHTFFEEYLHHYVPVLPRRLGRGLARTLTRSQCSDVTALLAPSAPMRDALLEYGVRTPIHVMPTGLPPDRFRPGNGRAFRERHGFSHERPLLLHVGRVAHEKNIDFVLRMFAEVRRARPDAQLLIAGEGPAVGALERLAGELGIASDVRFIGYLERATELNDCYAAADAFVFASRTETQGLVLLEALAQRTPVVSTAVLGTRSVLVPDCGALVVEEDIAEFSAAVLRVLADPALRESLAARARAHAREWSSTNAARRLHGLYGEVLSGRPAPAAVLSGG